MARVTTTPEIYLPLYGVESIELDRCAICGRTWPLNRHHLVWRSWGQAYDEEGQRLKKPTITLCGSGNTGGCHGLAHHRRLHFRVTAERLEYLITDRPTRYEAALDMDGWRDVL